MNTSKESDTPFTFTIVNTEAIITGALAPIKAATLKIPTHLRGAKIIAIEATAFDGLDIEAFEVDDDSSIFKTIEGVLYNKEGSELIAYPKARRDDFLKIPDGVITVGKRSLSKARNLSCVDLNHVTTIRNSGLRACTKLEKLIIGEGFVSLDAFGLGFCTKLKNVEFPSCDSIGDWSFAGTFRLESLFFHERMPDRLGLYAFSDAGMASTVVLFSNGTVTYKIAELGPEFVASQVNKEVSI